MISSPCKNCEKRYVGCHAYCDDYKKFKEDTEKQNEKIRNDNFASRSITRTEFLGNTRNSGKVKRRFLMD